MYILLRRLSCAPPCCCFRHFGAIFADYLDSLDPDLFYLGFVSLESAQTLLATSWASWFCAFLKPGGRSVISLEQTQLFLGCDGLCEPRYEHMLHRMRYELNAEAGLLDPPATRKHFTLRFGLLSQIANMSGRHCYMAGYACYDHEPSACSLHAVFGQ